MSNNSGESSPIQSLPRSNTVSSDEDNSQECENTTVAVATVQVNTNSSPGMFKKLRRAVSQMFRSSETQQQPQEVDIDALQRQLRDKKCSSKSVRCCGIVKKMSVAELLIYIGHWEDHIDDLWSDSRRRRKVLDIHVAVDQIFTPNIIDMIMPCTPLNLPVGIVNPDLECFAISVMQSLMMCPPFVQYVINKQVDPENTLDMLVRSFVAQYLCSFKFTRVTRILSNVLHDDNVKPEQDDANHFYESFANAYLGEQLSKVRASYTFKCTCGCVSYQTSDDNSLQLEWPEDTVVPYIGIVDMICATRQPRIVDRYCYICKENKLCTTTVTYELPEVLVATTCPYYHGLDPKAPSGSSEKVRLLRPTRAQFSSVQDFGDLTESEMPCFYNLASIVYYDRHDNETGHYFARIFHEGHGYIADDAVVRPQFLPGGHLRKVNGRAYFAVYYKSDVDYSQDRSRLLRGPLASAWV